MCANASDCAVFCDISLKALSSLRCRLCCGAAFIGADDEQYRPAGGIKDGVQAGSGLSAVPEQRRHV